LSTLEARSPTTGGRPRRSSYEFRSWREEIGTMWRFSRTNSITVGFRNNVELPKRQTSGFRSFNNYRM